MSRSSTEMHSTEKLAQSRRNSAGIEFSMNRMRDAHHVHMALDFPIHISNHMTDHLYYYYLIKIFKSDDIHKSILKRHLIYEKVKIHLYFAPFSHQINWFTFSSPIHKSFLENNLCAEINEPDHF